MVESEQMQDGGVQVVDMDLVLGGIVTELVGRTVSESRFCTATGQPLFPAGRTISATGAQSARTPAKRSESDSISG